MDLNKYLEYVNWNQTGLDHPVVDFKTLSALHNRHILTFPFENFDVFLTGETSLQHDKLFDKMVNQKRGGWCFELNGLLYSILKQIGFKVRPLMARNRLAPGKPRTHQILLVECENQIYLVDAGFGGTCIQKPHRLENQYIQNHGGLDFKLILQKPEITFSGIQEPDNWLLQILKNDEWSNLYEFTLEQFEYEDFIIGNHFHTTSQLSPFTAQRLVIKVHPETRWILINKSVREYVVENKNEVINREYIIQFLMKNLQNLFCSIYNCIEYTLWFFCNFFKPSIY